MAMTGKNATSSGYVPIILVCLMLLIVGGCATPAPPTAPAPPPSKVEVSKPAKEYRSDDYVVLTAASGDSYNSLARSYLGDEKLAYLISDFNQNMPVVTGERIVIPLKSENPGGLYADGYLTIPVLCYHRFYHKKSPDKITVSEETFNRQMAYLKSNGYTPLTLQQFSEFIDSRRRPPQKSLLITIDDGLKSVKTIAYPILKKYGFPAVLFVNTDTIQTKQNPPTLTWDDLREMRDSGIIEIESHAASHKDLTKYSDEQLQQEIADSRQKIKSILGITTDYLAYPYGLFNRSVIDSLRQHGYRAAFTVIRGGNPSFAHPYAINRSMVYNSDRIEDFAKMLDTYRREEQ
ncbi:putative polysaccharide deacetylase YxkH [Geobacter sp. OR-1]|uniref:polysaccharide deacetylase family protein n=1 Tax=Geobacter sp. OR-1 TaxID=1266765 RepID=UPI00054424A8|nr:polysaccharide deacetylase family protein [Geobacter sp. OR-1]GAM09395.1 putative polysaccharide deacetylase YxkH [Geobacter sp. OR-1]